MTSITLAISSKVSSFRISPHPGSSNSVANGNGKSPSLAISSGGNKREEEIDLTTNNKISSSTNAAAMKSGPEVKLSSFGMPRLYSRVEITLENTLLPEEKLSTPPSLQDGLEMQTERDLRYLGSELIQKASMLLKLPQVAAATGQILYQRFYCAKSFVRYDFEVTAMACVNLASKIEEAPRRIRDVMNVFHHMRQLIKKRDGGQAIKIQPLVLDKEYSRVKNEVIKAERRVLKELGFCVHVKHPHKLIYAYLQALKALDKKELIQRAWNYMNDSLRTDIFLRHMPETIACACIFLAARDLSVPLPDDPPWFHAFDADRAAVENICRILIDLYRRKKPSWAQLEARWMEAKKRLAEKQMQNRPVAEITPNRNAVNSGTEKGSPSNVSAHPSRQGSPKPNRRTDRDRDRDSSRRRRQSTTKNGSPRRGGRSKSRSRTRSRSRSPRDRNLPKRYADDYRRHNRVASSYISKSKNRGSSKKYESSKYVDRRKR